MFRCHFQKTQLVWRLLTLVILLSTGSTLLADSKQDGELTRLRQQLTSLNEYERCKAVKQLVALKKDEKQVISLLIAALADEQQLVRQEIVEGLVKIGQPAFTPLAQAIHDPNPLIRAGVMEILGSSNWDETKRAQLLVKGLSDPDPSVQGYALLGLPNLSAPQEALAPLLSLLQTSPDPRIKLRVAAKLEFYGAKAEGAIPTLIHILVNDPPAETEDTHGYSVLQEICQITLSEIGHASVSPLLAIAKKGQRNPEGCSRTLGSLRAFVEKDKAELLKEGLPIFCELLDDPVIYAENYATLYELIGSQKQKARKALKQIRAKLQTANEEQKLCIAVALFRITDSTDESAPLLQELVKSPTAEVRLEALYQFFQFTNDKPDFSPVAEKMLIPATIDPDMNVRLQAIHWLGGVPNLSPKGSKRLQFLAKDRDPKISEPAQRLLRKVERR